eukprot:8781692-Pyramimonas_sp.AAC.1
MDRSSWQLQQLGGATMLEGIYDAIASNPDNKFVKLLQQQGGLPGVVLLRRQIPLDAQKYIRDEGN